ncbi:MAG: HAMP domain-containing histidine kinase [Clostridia bacterium]|nr:HAMP domain-containing histidine kinase [Clostridia bacterium]
MRKIIYSGFVKTVAVLLFVAGIVLGVLAVTNGIVLYCNEDEQLYSFESDFSESSYIRYLLNEPESAVWNAYYDIFRDYGYDTEIDREKAVATHKDELEKNVKQKLERIYVSDKIHYYVRWNDLVVTNCDAENPEDVKRTECYSYIKREKDGEIERNSTSGIHMLPVEELSRYDKTSEIVIACSVKEDVIRECRAVWEFQEEIVTEAFAQTLICVIAALLSLAFLLCVCGRTKDGDYVNIWLDRIPTELHLAVLGGAGVGAAALCWFLLEEYVRGSFPRLWIGWTVGAVSALGGFLLVTSLLSLVRNIKTGKLFERSIVFCVLRWSFRLLAKLAVGAWRLMKAFGRAVFRTLTRKTGAIMIVMLFVYTATIGVLCVCTLIAPILLVAVIFLFGAACFIAAYRSKDLDEVKKGVGEIRNGNVSYKIPELHCEDMKALALNVNGIAKGLDESVAAQVKAERLKTELITNVSHDLKTPVTSIINYTELLRQMEELPEEARDYLAVIAKKSDRLKSLTQDLFDISKARSGNEDIVWERLDAALLIQQTLGEHDGEIQGSGLTFCVKAPKELYFSADGRKMSRVFGNLIHNILKYTMKNTRVFITASEKDGNAVLEFKNISAYPLSFEADEITERFVRGDASRTAEGNGLGLAIAKSYTELCNGSFEIIVDGDMFKAVLKFKRCD